MMRLLTVLLLIVAVAGAAVPVSAQSDIGTAMGSLFVSATSDSYEPFVTVEPFTLFEFFVITEIDYADVGLPALNGENTMGAAEFRLDVDPRLILGNPVIGPGDGIQVGVAPDYILGFSAGLPSGQFSSVLSFQAMIANEEATDAYVLLTGVQDAPATFENGEPGWAERGLSEPCTNRASGAPIACLRNFVRIEGLVVNCTNEPACRAVPTEQRSFGGLKARY